MKQKSLATLKKDLWKLFTTKLKQNENNLCFTCGRYCEGRDCHGGHFIKASVCGIELYFHPDNVHVQCSYCNIRLDGNQYVYGEKLGKRAVSRLRKLRDKTKGARWDRQKFEKEIALYK